MALRPCSCCHRMYRGAAQHVYPTLITRSGSYANHLRLCGPDAEIVRSSWESNNMRADEGLPEDSERPGCPVCGVQVDLTEATQFFATSYWGRDQRADYWAPVHEECAGQLSADFALVFRP